MKKMWVITVDGTLDEPGEVFGFENGSVARSRFANMKASKFGHGFQLWEAEANGEFTVSELERQIKTLLHGGEKLRWFMKELDFK